MLILHSNCIERILERVQTGDKTLYQDCQGKMWTFVCDVLDDKHLGELRNKYSVYRKDRRKTFPCRTVKHFRRKTKGKLMTMKERIKALKHRCNYRMLFVPLEKLKPDCEVSTMTTNGTMLGALFSRGEHNHPLIQRLKNLFILR